MAKHIGKIKPKCNETMSEKVKNDVPKSVNYNPRKSDNLETYGRMRSIVKELKEIYSPRKSVAYELLDELDMLLFTLMDEGAKVLENVVDGCIARKELTNEGIESVFNV